ncbi:MAG: aminomethyl-transferring glycine dehydrogenase subunit GcvPB [Myxococcales bacterium]|nr:aminomethyl-transferring glycine dehydrogenase subunit GcvPB [Myxococcales bacterium]
MTLGSAASGLTFQTPLIFEQGAPGRSGASLPPLDVPEVDPKAHFGDLAREASPGLPEVSEPEAVRHYVRLSQQNFAIDTGMYPLGSCTMKYNPKVNEWAARLSGFANLHPLTPDALAQGALELMHRLERGLAGVCGMDRVTLHPSAGAQGEYVGLMMIRAYHQAQGRSPKKVLIPDTAHGTNPASCALNGFKAVPFPVGRDGIVLASELAPFVDDDVAAIMLTNPNTVGLFESNIAELTQMVHEKGGLVYGDGANLNALMGKARPGDLGIDVMQFNLHKTFTTPHGGGGPGCGPVGYKSILAPYAPVPLVERDENGTYYLDYDRPESVGRVRAFHGNFGMMVRAYAYLREMGPEGLERATELAVLNANYLRVRLGELWHVAYDRPCMHEVVISDKHLKDTGVTTLDIAKRLIDYGFHPPTVYFPLVVKGAMLIEPTETETLQTLDRFVEVMAEIAAEAERDPEIAKGAPHLTRLRRLDEARAARKPVLRYTA